MIILLPVYLLFHDLVRPAICQLSVCSVIAAHNLTPVKRETIQTRHTSAYYTHVSQVWNKHVSSPPESVFQSPFERNKRNNMNAKSQSGVTIRWKTARWTYTMYSKEVAYINLTSITLWLFLTDFWNSFTGTLCGKVAIKLSLKNYALLRLHSTR